MSKPAKREYKDDESYDPAAELFSTRDFPLIYTALVAKKNATTIDRLTAPFGLNTYMWRVFGALHDFGAQHISQLAGRIAVERSQLSRLLDQMEDHGYIQRSVSQRDRRQTQLSFTEKGQQAFNTVRPIIAQHYENICQDISTTEMRVLIGSLNKMLENFEDSANEHS
jgi:DNA-binding MarR family transcriptional regulator